MTTVAIQIPNTHMRTAVMAVGPDLAARWLEGNTHNRPIHQSRVDHYAAEMKAGRWNLTHQGIAFDVNGVLRDGQHRLWAIVESGCTIQTLVTFNLAADVIEKIDDVKARTVCDRMNISGRFSEAKISTNQLSVLRAMVRGLRPSRRLAYHDECRLMAEHLPAIRFALEHLATTRIKGVSAPTVCAVVARAWYSQDTSLLERFCEVLRTGIAAPNEAVVILLRDYLGSRDCSNKLANLREQYGKAERALLAYIKGQSLTMLRPSQSEVFPLPNEGSPSR
jgi:hypothetical protein